MSIKDNFKKIIVVKDDIKSWISEEGILIIGLKEFLLNPNSLGLQFLIWQIDENIKPNDRNFAKHFV